uniref:Ribonuclease H-like domain-containing protein n=1 Tax=Tanacetum cinerariifolium TaxID=118510 RepID=A0A6L2JLC6_TANCI|nr:ribonuclease H-like domain-containing protein [Tanacetum cinerariifolium]
MAPVESPQMASSVELPIFKKEEYTLWSMRMKQYLTNIDYGLWQVIMNGDEPVQTTRDENGVETEVPSKTAQAILARQRERKAKSILLLADPDEYQLRFHTIKDAKSLWLLSRVEDTNNINEVNTANGDSTAAGHSSSGQASSSSYIDDLIYIAQEEPTEFALMAYTSGSDTEKNEVAYEEKITVLEFEVKDKGNAIIRLTNQLDQTLKEKENLNAKLEQFEISSKNLNKLINSQLSTKDKTSLGYGDQLSESDSEVLPSVFNSRSSDGDDNPTNDSIEMPKVDLVRTSRVIIKDWVSDDEDTLVDTQIDSQITVKPSFKKIEFTKARNESVKSDKQADKPKMVT